MMDSKTGLIRNSFRVFLQDVKKLFRAPAALVVALVLLILPSLYAWYNIVGFWDPYDNTGNLRVCVVSEDKGASNKLVGELDIGDMVISELKGNDQLDWEFTDLGQAQEMLQGGQAYAAFVIPEDFTKKLVDMTEGVYETPSVKYMTNEKAGPVSPKITDAGATTLDESINSMFVSTVSAIAVDAIDKSIEKQKGDVGHAKSVAFNSIDKAYSKMERANAKLADSSKAVEDASSQIENSRNGISGLKLTLDTASGDAKTLSRDLSSLQKELSAFSSKSWPLASSAITSVSSASTESASAVQSITSQTAQANAYIQTSAVQAQSAIDQARDVSAILREAAGSLPQGSQAANGIYAACDALDSEIDSMSANLNDIQSISSNISDSQAKINDAAAANNDSVQKLMKSMQGATDVFFGTTAPAINSSILHLSQAIGKADSTIPAQQALLEELDVVLGETRTALDNSKTAIDSTREAIEGFSADLENLKTDAASILSSEAVKNLIGTDDLDANAIAEFMGSPTQVHTESLFSPNAYGASMAPLFMNLTFWIGAFMLMVIMKQEVYYPQIKHLTAAQSYLGRFLLFACMVVLQAAICCFGLIAIGVKAVSMPALLFAACFTSLSYLSIIYALSTTLQHLGKGICILLVFAQIPGATGLYPVEMTSPFFQAIYPFLPFTYGIEAMRESICGFYEMTYVKDLLVLGVFFVVFMVVGMAVRPLLANVSRMASMQVRKSGIYNGEKSMVPPRPYRFSQVVRMLADKKEYKAQIERRYGQFLKWYPRIIKGSIVGGIAVPVALVVVFALTPAEKVVILTIWLAFLIALIAMLVIVESLKNSLKRQLALEGASDDQILKFFAKKDTAASSESTSLSNAADSPVGDASPNADDSPDKEAMFGPASSPDADATIDEAAPAETAGETASADLGARPFPKSLGRRR